MSTPSRIAKAGTLLCVDQGKYSTYELMGFFVVLRDFDPMIALDEFLAEPQEHKNPLSYREDQFLAALLEKGLLLEIEYGALNLGDFLSLANVRFTPIGKEEQQ